MRHLVMLLALAVGLSSVNAEAKSHKKKRHHKPKAKAVQTSNTVQMDMEFEVNGSLVATPHISAELGKMATITGNSADKTVYTIEVTPTKPKPGQVKMMFEISRMADGRKEVISRPSILSLNGEKARMEQKSDNGNTMSIEVTAKL